MVNQIRLCPGETQDEVVEYSRAQGMILEAYSPLGTGKIFAVPQMQVLASEKNNREQRRAEKAEREQAEGKKRAKRREKSRREEG